jgi:DNA-binding transcriptional LysR family regulator
LIRAVSYQVVDHVRAGRLRIVMQSFEPAPRPVHLVYDAQNRLPLKLRAFVDFVVPRMRERLIDAAP